MDLEKLRVFVRLTELGERVLPKASLRDSYPEVTMHLTVALTGQVEKRTRCRSAGWKWRTRRSGRLPA